MRKKKLLLLFWFIVLAVAISTGLLFLKKSSKNWFKKVEIAEYGMKISYPNSYIDIESKNSNLEEISNNAAEIIVGNKIGDTNIDVELVKEILNVKSELTGITIYCEAIKKEKTTKSIEDICRDYIVMFEVFNPYEEIFEQKYSETKVDGKSAGRTEIYVKGKIDEVYPGMISYLIPLEDREITIVFSATKDILNYYKDSIEKIVASIELEDKLVINEENKSGE